MRIFRLAVLGYHNYASLQTNICVQIGSTVKTLKENLDLLL